MRLLFLSFFFLLSVNLAAQQNTFKKKGKVWYVAKYICDEKTNWKIVKLNT